MAPLRVLWQKLMQVEPQHVPAGRRHQPISVYSPIAKHFLTFVMAVGGTSTGQQTLQAQSSAAVSASSLFQARTRSWPSPYVSLLDLHDACSRPGADCVDTSGSGRLPGR